MPYYYLTNHSKTMRKLLLLGAGLFIGLWGMSQTIVDTLPQNKNVVLEEFTGIHCGFCPDGHKISEQIAAANPNDFFAINIHVGSYATPSAGEPDFRTQWGTAISGQSGLTGYPAGTVNRHLFAGMSQGTGTAMSRSNWSTATTQTIAQPSYVNLAASADINLATKEMTLLVEGYFTGTGAPASMKLNVALLQNNIEGPQSGSSANPSQVLPNGNYNHMHMLRDLLTGQWGISIDTTAQGTFFSRSFTYQIPTAITNIPVELADLEIIVFIAEGNQEIVTGNKAVINYITPPGVFNVDMKIENKTTTPGLCDVSVTPKVLITNTSTTNTADTFNVEYTMNGGTAVSQLYTSSPLAPGDTMTVSFPSINITEMSNQINFAVDVDDAYHLIDIAASNNLTATPVFYNMPVATIGTIHSETFESYADYDEEIDNALVLNPNDNPAFVLSKGGVTGLTTELGGFGGSTYSYFVNLYSISAGGIVELMFRKIDFSGNTQYGMKFNYAYAQYSSENDKLEVMVSDDCGSTWTTVFNKAGANLKTTEPVSSGNFFPTPQQWKAENLDLSAFNGKSNVIVKFKVTSDYGNNLLIDDINIYNNTNVGIEKPENTNMVNIYPNPAQTSTIIDLTLSESSPVAYTIINATGQVVLTQNLGEISAGSHLLNVDLTNLSAGIYNVNLLIDGRLESHKLIIK